MMKKNVRCLTGIFMMVAMLCGLGGCTGIDHNGDVDRNAAEVGDKEIVAEDISDGAEETDPGEPAHLEISDGDYAGLYECGGDKSDPEAVPETLKEEEAMNTIRLFVGEKELSVAWEDNESVDALRELVKEHPLSVQMSMYGGFEQVGALGAELPRNDVRTTTEAGDIVLYSGNQIVMFYGSNSWAYTRLGRVTDMSVDEMSELLGNGDVMLTLSDQAAFSGQGQ